MVVKQTTTINGIVDKVRIVPSYARHSFQLFLGAAAFSVFGEDAMAVFAAFLLFHMVVDAVQTVKMMKKEKVI